VGGAAARTATASGHAGPFVSGAPRRVNRATNPPRGASSTVIVSRRMSVSVA
jgi:hypothetical protein